MGRNETISALLARAKAEATSTEDDADLVVALGEALARGSLGTEQLRDLRLALADRAPRDEAKSSYWRAIRDVVRAVEASRLDDERRRSRDELLRRGIHRDVLLALGAEAAGPSAVALRIRKDQGAVSRAMQSLEDAELIAHTDEGHPDRRSRQRELTAAGHAALRELDELPSSLRTLSHDALGHVADAVVGTLMDVRVFGELPTEELVSLAMRHRLGDSLTRKLVSELLRAAEVSRALDYDQTTVRWGPVQPWHRELHELVAAAPALWDQTVDGHIGDGEYVLVVKDTGAWRTALRRGERNPSDIVSPYHFACFADLHDSTHVTDDRSLARTLPGVGRRFVASAENGRLDFERPS